MSRSMHVLVLARFYSPVPRSGGALRVRALVRQLLAEGHQATVLRHVAPGDDPSPPVDDVPVYDIRVPSRYELPPVAILAHWLSRQASALASRVHAEHPIDLVQSDPPWPAMSGQRIARRLGIPHVMLAHNCESRLAADMSRESRARRIPLIGDVIADSNVALVRWAETRTVKSASLVMIPSLQDREDMRALDMRTDRTVILPNGTSMRPESGVSRTVLRERLGIDQQAPIAIFTGRLDYKPNLDAVLAIATVIAPSCPEARFLIVGSNPPAMPLPLNVLLRGNVDDVAPYLSAADLSIVPLLHGSGTRIKILDAWAAGVPVLSTSVGASGLACQPGKDIVIEDDLGAFPRRIQALLRDPQALAWLSAHGLEAVRPYRWDVVGNQYIKALALVAGAV